MKKHKHHYTTTYGGTPSDTNDTIIELICLSCGDTKRITVSNSTALYIFKNLNDGKRIMINGENIYLRKENI